MPNPGESAKLDASLAAALHAYEVSSDGDRHAAAGISVALRFEGDLTAIEALGFETHLVTSNEALGVLWFQDLPALIAHPGVLRIAAGRRHKSRLDTAVRDIQARAMIPISGAPIDGLWNAVIATGALTNVPDATGKDVIVAIIDTGIDYKHPMFMSQLAPTKKSRILRIWDQGLVPAALADCPPVARLASPSTYGVEFDTTKIEADLNGGAALAHKDCDGHGTHVAGIAAGGVLFPPGGDAGKVGVAPEASIIAVKYIDTPDHIFYRLAAGPGAEVGWTLRFRDAVLYCLRTARALSKPVVINMSFGSGAMPGDGLDDDAVFVDQLMNPASAPGPLNFPRGAVVVHAAGNDGDITDRQLARITVPAGGEITVPIELSDTRGVTQTRWEQCAQRLHKPSVGVNFWYRRASAVLSVRFTMRSPNNGPFGTNVLVGGTLTRGFVPRIGPPLSVSSVAPSANVHRMKVEHEDTPAAPHPAGGTVRRQRVYCSVEPKESGGTISYHPGIYEVRIQAPAGTEIFALCDQEFWGPGLTVIFRIANTMQDGSLLHGNIRITNEFTATDTLGQHAITVAAYDEGNANHIASFSSRGPLRDFSDPATPLPVIPKPDIAGPGVRINSAEGVDTEALLPRTPNFAAGIRFHELSGTSMAAPVVAGVIALMLDKKADLHTAETRSILAAAVRAAVVPAMPPASTNAYGSGMVDALPSHTATP